MTTEDSSHLSPNHSTIDKTTAKPYFMVDDEFEWDDQKAARNVALHGVTFEMARAVFRDPFALDWLDDRQDYGEDRYATIGMVEGRLLYVAYTMRDERIRIISARGAEPFERRQYDDDNA